MLNQVVLVGRIVKEPEIKELENGKRVSNITLAVPQIIHIDIPPRIIYIIFVFLSHSVIHVCNNNFQYTAYIRKIFIAKVLLNVFPFFQPKLLQNNHFQQLKFRNYRHTIPPNNHFLLPL